MRLNATEYGIRGKTCVSLKEKKMARSRNKIERESALKSKRGYIPSGSDFKLKAHAQNNCLRFVLGGAWRGSRRLLFVVVARAKDFEIFGVGECQKKPHIFQLARPTDTFPDDVGKSPRHLSERA